MYYIFNLYAYEQPIWLKKESYISKWGKTEEFDPANMIEFKESGMLNFEVKSIRQLRDFCLDGTEIEIIERKVNF
jgi:hypothetical protein